MKQSGQTHKTCDSYRKEILDQSAVRFNILQTQPGYLNFSINQIEDAIEQNIAAYFQVKPHKEYIQRKSQTNIINKNLDLLLKRMISKIQAKLFQTKQKQTSSLTQNFDVVKDKTFTECQNRQCKQIVKKIQSENQSLHSKNLALKTEIRQLKSSLLVLNQAYIESRNHFQQEIKELQQNNLKKQENEPFYKGSPYLLTLPSMETLRSHQIQTVKHLSYREGRQNNYMTKSSNCQKYQTRANQAKSSNESSSIQSKKSIQHFQLKINRMLEQNKRIRQCLNQSNTKLRKEIKNTDKLTKQVEKLAFQNTKLQESNLKKKAMIEKLMKTIEKKYQIFKKQ